jgi:hypothetical protein
MPTKTMTTVSTHSRKGGVGKTSIILSAVIQLAAKGKKVAVLDLDTQGAYLSQGLPLRRDYLQENHSLRFNLERHGAPDVADYVKRPWWSWMVTGDPFKRTGKSSIPLEECRTGLAIDDSVRKNMAHSLRVPLRNIEENLHLFLLSPYLRDLDNLNKMVFSGEGQKVYRGFLSRAQVEMRDLGYEYLFLDNSSGLSFNPGNNLAWILEEARRARDGSFITWLVTGPPWWEQGLVIYEVNVFAGALARCFPTLIVNRVAGPWIGKEAFAPGKRVAIGREQEFTKEFASKSFAIPIWFTAGKKFDVKDLIPNTMSVAILGESLEIRDASLRPEDVEAGAPAELGKDSDPDIEGGARGEPGEVLHAPTLSALFTKWSMKFIQDFVLKAAGCDGKGTTFHDHVRSALVNHLISEG